MKDWERTARVLLDNAREFLKRIRDEVKLDLRLSALSSLDWPMRAFTPSHWAEKISPQEPRPQERLFSRQALSGPAEGR